MLAVGSSTYDQLVDSWHSGIPRYAMLAEQSPKLEGTEALGHDHRAARSERGQGRCYQTMDVEERHHTERDVVLCQPVGGDDVGDRSCKVAVSKWDHLGPAGRATGVENQRQVVIPRFGQSATERRS